MQRNMDMCRQILLEIESAPPLLSNGAGGYFESIDLDGYTQEEIWYHIRLLRQAGLIDAIDASSSSGAKWFAKDLTWAGHEFLDMARSNSNWNKAKSWITDKGQSLTLEAVKLALQAVVRQSLGI